MDRGIVTTFVPRTCTEIDGDGSSNGSGRWPGGALGRSGRPGEEDRPVVSQPPRSLEDFRERDAYVLLGAPGAGKTVEFEREADECEDGCYVTARDFITFADRPEWHDATLLIDGLDEMRAGAADGRTPLNAIRAKLDVLERPRFRLSCREADWFGASDRKHLESVSASGKVTVLRLDPLSGNGIRELLRRRSDIEGVDEFVEEARERGIDSLLASPQSLRMLAEAAAGGTWPKTRMETFDLACEKLVREQNPEHRCARRDRPALPELLSAAGRLCALQLLTGAVGYAVPGGESNDDYLGLEHIPGDRREMLRHALGTKLFESFGEGCLAPVHRQVAEFLAARYLAKLIEDGLPAGRVLALMAGGDGGIVSELRGLSAWLAAHSKTSRAEIVARDPLGTVLYGDVRGFSPDEKCGVLSGLKRMTERNPRFQETVGMDSRLGALAALDMEEVFRSHLRESPVDDAGQRFQALLLQSLIHGPPIPGPAGLLMEIVRDDRRWPGIRRLALDAFLRHAGPDAPSELEKLLADVHAGAVSDEDHDLLGTLLSALYPESLSPAEILQYLKPPEPSSDSYPGLYYRFWRYEVPERSTSDQLAELLDGLVDRFDELRPVLAGAERPQAPVAPLKLLGRGRLPLALLTRFLEMSQDDVASRRLFDWLGIASDRRLGALPRDADSVRTWLDSHPEVQREVIATGVARCAGSPDFAGCMRAVEHRLFRVERPPDFGRWCLDQALAANDGEVASWFMERVAVSVHRRRHDEGLSLEVVEERIRGRTPLVRTFIRELDRLLKTDELDADKRREDQARRMEGQQEWEEWRDAIRSHRAALRENRAEPSVLEQLAMSYFGRYVNVEGDTPRGRLQYLLADEDLIEEVTDAFRGAIRRSDVPSPAEIIRLHACNRGHHLALPFLAGLEELGRAAPMATLPLEEEQIRQALALHYTIPAGASPAGAVSEKDRPRNWYKPLLTEHPGIAADILVEVIRAELRSGRDHAPGVYKLGDSEEVARLAALPLLESFPVRCTAEQVNDLSYLLRTALLRCDAEELLGLIDRKLAHRSMNPAERIHWLGARLLASAASESAPSRCARLEEYVAGNERRIRHLAGFMAKAMAGDGPFSTLTARLDVSALQLLVRLMAAVHQPAADPFDPRSRLIQHVIDRLAFVPTPDATDALKKILDDEALHSWRPALLHAEHQQVAARREAEFGHPDLARVAETLANRRPANASDLAALAFDLLTEISRNIRDGSTNDWRQYWNEPDREGSRTPRHEDDCRDALLSDLRYRLAPLGVDATPEGRFADEKRSDIRVSFGGFNVPIEIKKSNHRNLWSAIGSQLIARYTRDPGADGHGIYVVFWLGDDPKLLQPPGSGRRPKSAAELEERLRATLAPEQANLIGVRVIDVARPA